MLKKSLLILLVLALCAPAAMASDLWLHVRVEEKTGDEETVRVNIPLSLVKTILPMIDDPHFRDGKVMLGDEVDLQNIDLQELWKAIEDTPDGEYVTVKSKKENVRVAKENGFLLVNVDEGEGDSAETVRVKIPITVVSAMLSADAKQIDVMAALEALADYDGDIVTVQEKDTTVRIWIDKKQEAL